MTVEAACEHVFTEDGIMGAERCVLGHGCVSICVLAHSSVENTMSSSYLYSRGRPLRAWQTAPGAGKGLDHGAPEGTIKGLGSNLLKRRLKGKFVIVSSQRNTF